MTLTQLGAWLMLASGGLFAGGVLVVAVERTNLWRRMPVEQYADDFRRSLSRVDPMLPILGAVSGIAAFLFAISSDGRPAALAWISTALVAVIIVGSLAVAEPINSRFRRLPEGQVPDAAERLRITWRRFHTGRTLLALASFACLAAAAA
jgi:anthrone oxygenase-like protein